MRLILAKMTPYKCIFNNIIRMKRYPIPFTCSLPAKRLYCNAATQEDIISHLKTKVDRFGSIWLDFAKINPDLDIKYFEKVLVESIVDWKKEGVSAVLINVPIDKSTYIPCAANAGFQFHHAENNQSLLYLWLKDDITNKIPRYATHQVGVAGCVIREDNNEILVVQDKHKTYKLWKFPGGLSELSEDIAKTAEREVKEETGIDAEFQGILAFRQHHEMPGAFGRSDLYFLCHLKALSYDIQACPLEIEKCQWMNFDELYEKSTTPITRQVLKVIKKGLYEDFNLVDLPSKKLKSVYGNMHFDVFHANLQEK